MKEMYFVNIDGWGDFEVESTDSASAAEKVVDALLGAIGSPSPALGRDLKARVHKVSEMEVFWDHDVRIVNHLEPLGDIELTFRIPMVL